MRLYHKLLLSHYYFAATSLNHLHKINLANETSLWQVLGLGGPFGTKMGGTINQIIWTFASCKALEKLVTYKLNIFEAHKNREV
jgi:hypothetical protein